MAISLKRRSEARPTPDSMTLVEHLDRAAPPGAHLRRGLPGRRPRWPSSSTTRSSSSSSIPTARSPRTTAASTSPVRSTASPCGSRSPPTGGCSWPRRCCCGSSGDSSPRASTRRRSGTPSPSSWRRSPCSPSGAWWPSSPSPTPCGWLDSIGGPSLTQILDPTKYLSLIVLLMTVFGLTFEFPVLLVSLELAGVLTPAEALLVATVGHRAHRGGGRGGDPELRPLLDDGAGHPAVHLLRAVDRHREDHQSMSPGRARGPPGAPGERPAEGFRAGFEQRLGFRLDPFQTQAMDALDRGESVLVSAPDRLGQDAGRRVRRRPGPRVGGQGLLHHADQGPLQPEVRRAVAAATGPTGSAC